MQTLDPHPPDHRRAGRRSRAGRIDARDRIHKDRSSSAARSPTTSVQFMLADMAMKVEAARLMVYTRRARRAW